MINPWYELVDANATLTQGDIIFNCPLLSWIPDTTDNGKYQLKDYSPDSLMSRAGAYWDDVVVVTQACDLEHKKVSNVVLCPHVALSEFKESWERTMDSMKQTPSAKAWRRFCQDIANGHLWNHAFLNCLEQDGFDIEVRIVDFHDVYTIPREFLEGMLIQRNQRRLRLLPPYREHLSQAFARFFMRVGLPQPVEKMW